MKELVDRLSAELSDRYVHYLETFLVELWSEAGFIEFRCLFTLRSDHLLRRFKIKVAALAGDTDAERRLIVVMIFDEIEEKIDLAIAERKRDAN
jgi:hypothetical protein